MQITLRPASREAGKLSLLATACARSTLVRFLIAGGLSYVVNQGCLVLLYEYAFASFSRGRWTPLAGIDIGLLLASFIAVEASILVRFALNDCWTFKDRHTRLFADRFWRFNLSSFGSPLISLTAVNILTPYFGVSYLLANSLGIALGLGWNWFYSNSVVWKRVPNASRHP